MTTSVASGPVYAGFAVDDIDAVNQDDDSAGIVVSTGVTTTTGAGGSFVVSYKLTSAPTAAVVLTVASGDTSENRDARRRAHFRRRDVGPDPVVTVTSEDGCVADGDVASSACDECCQRRPGLRRLCRG
ncbi:MAG: hypothetical protein R2838_17065 [Caldilineaceae bacterium]